MVKKSIITLGGLPGSGKSTVKSLLAEHFVWNSFSTGDFMRQTALARGLSFDEFNALIATDKSLDEEIDAKLIDIEHSHNQVIVDSHLAFHFVPSSYKVFLDISLPVSASRIYKDNERKSRKSVGDTMDSIEEAESRIAARITNHNDRYMRYYNVSPYDKSQYDLVINTEKYTPQEVSHLIIAGYKNWIKN
jgi:CMP/dCMP kinase